MNPIRVVSVRGIPVGDPRRDGIVYVGRRMNYQTNGAVWPHHPLANPFRVRRTAHSAAGPADCETVAECLAKYRPWLLARPTLLADLAALWEASGRGAKSLGCWCGFTQVPGGPHLDCHAAVLAEMLWQRFGPKGEAA